MGRESVGGEEDGGAFQGALLRFFECFEDFLDDHKENAFNAVFQEPARFYLTHFQSAGPSAEAPPLLLVLLLLLLRIPCRRRWSPWACTRGQQKPRRGMIWSGCWGAAAASQRSSP